MPRGNLIEKVIFKEKSKGNRRVRRITHYSKHYIKEQSFHLIFLTTLLEVVNYYIIIPRGCLKTMVTEILTPVQDLREFWRLGGRRMV